MTVLSSNSNQTLNTTSNVNFNNATLGYNPITTSGGTTTLTVNSANYQDFIGTQTQTIVMPVTSTLTVPQGYIIINRSTQAVTVKASDGSTIQLMGSNSRLFINCNSTSITSSAAWNILYIPNLPAQFVTQQQVQQSAFNYGVDTGIADAYVVNLSPAVTALTDGLLVSFQPVNSNVTSTPTLQINGLTPVDIVNSAFGSLLPGDLSIPTCLLMYDAAQNSFILLNALLSNAVATQLTNNSYNFGMDTGVANAYVYNSIYTGTGYVPNPGATITFMAAHSNTTASTIKVGDASALPILLPNGSALTAGMMLIAQSYTLIFNSPSNSTTPAWILQNPSIINLIPTLSGQSITASTTPPTSPLTFTAYYTNAYQKGSYTGQLISATLDYPQSDANITAINTGNIQQLLNPTLALTWTNCTSISMPSMLTIYAPITSGTFTSLTTLSLPSLTSFVSAFSPTMPALTTLTLTNLVECYGVFSPVVAALTILNMPALTTFNTTWGGTYTSLTTVNMPNLVSVGANGSGQVMPNSLPAITSLSLPSLTTVGNSNGGGDGNFINSLPLCTSLSCPNLVSIGKGFGLTAASLTSINLNSLQHVLLLNFTLTAAVLTSLSLPAFISSGQNFQLTCASLTSLSVPSLATVPYQLLITAGVLPTISLPALISVGDIITIVAANLVTFSFGSTLKSVGGNVTITGAKLSQASVDGILVSLAALNGTGGTTAYSSLTINLSGGTSSTPSATGLAAKATLVARSCTVTTN